MQKAISNQEELEFLAKLTNPKITHIREETEEEFIRLYNKNPQQDIETWRQIVNAIGNVWGYNIAGEMESKAKHPS